MVYPLSAAHPVRRSVAASINIHNQSNNYAEYTSFVGFFWSDRYRDRWLPIGFAWRQINWLEASGWMEQKLAAFRVYRVRNYVETFNGEGRVAWTWRMESLGLRQQIYTRTRMRTIRLWKWFGWRFQFQMENSVSSDCGWMSNDKKSANFQLENVVFLALDMDLRLAMFQLIHVKAANKITSVLWNKALFEY